MAEVILFRPAENPNALLSTRCPLGLVYIGTYLAQKGYSVKIIDSGSCKDWLSELKNSLDSSTVCVGVSVMTGYQIKGALDFAKAVKQIRKIPVVWGGLHPSLLPDQTIKNDFVDVVVIGEGEKTFLHLLENIKSNRNLDTIGNIVFKQDGELKHSQEDKEPIDLNTLPLPDYGLINFEYYSIFSDANGLYNNKRVIGLNTDRGCPYGCDYCYNLKFNKGRYRMIHAERVLDLLCESKKRYNMDGVNFISDNFFVNKNRVYNICKGIIDRKLNIAWHTDMRIDTFLEYDKEMIETMKKSGCDRLTFGVESGSDRILSLIHKDLTKDGVISAHKKAKEYGFSVNYHFMIGFPDETHADIKATLKLMSLLGKDKNVNFYGPSMYVPYPGTPLYDKCVELGFNPPERLEGWIQYDWTEYSKLPWFGKSFKNYMVEVQHVARYSHLVPNRGVLYKIHYYFCRMRLIGLIRGIRLYNIDKLIVNFLKRVRHMIKRRPGPITT